MEWNRCPQAGEPVTARLRDILVGFVTASGPLVNAVFLASPLVTTADEDHGLDSTIVAGALVASARAMPPYFGGGCSSSSSSSSG